VGANFRLWLKKSHRLSHGQSTGKKGPAFLTGQRCPYVRVGLEFGGFLGLGEKVFSITSMPRGWSDPMQVEFYLIAMNYVISISKCTITTVIKDQVNVYSLG